MSVVPWRRTHSSVRTSPQRVKPELGWCIQTAKCSLPPFRVDAYDWAAVLILSGPRHGKKLSRVFRSQLHANQFCSTSESGVSTRGKIGGGGNHALVWHHSCVLQAPSVSHDQICFCDGDCEIKESDLVGIHNSFHHHTRGSVAN